MMKKETIRELLIKYRNGDLEARDKIIYYYMEKARLIASKYFNLGLERDDVISYAYEGLVLEITTSKTNSHIQEKIENYIEKAILTSYGVLGENEHISNKKFMKILKAKRDLLRSKKTPPTIEEISKSVNLPIREVKYYLELISRTKFSGIDNIITDSYETSDPFIFLISTDLKELIENVINSYEFTPLEKIIIEEIYLSKEPIKLRSLARDIKHSFSNVLKIEKRALRKLRNKITEEYQMSELEELLNLTLSKEK